MGIHIGAGVTRLRLPGPAPPFASAANRSCKQASGRLELLSASPCVLLSISTTARRFLSPPHRRRASRPSPSRFDAPPQSLPVLLLGAAAHEAMIWSRHTNPPHKAPRLTPPPSA